MGGQLAAAHLTEPPALRAEVQKAITLKKNLDSEHTI